MYTRGLLSGLNGVIADDQTTDSTAWSSARTQEAVDDIIDDSVQDTDTTWSSTKIAAEIAGGGGGGGGNVVGPVSSTTSAIARYADTTGKLISNSTVLVSTAAGSAAAPALAFASSPQSGFYPVSATSLELSLGGTVEVTFGPANTQFRSQVRAQAGSLAVPGLSFSGSTSTGLTVVSGALVSSVGGTSAISATASQVAVAPLVSLVSGEGVTMPLGARMQAEASPSAPLALEFYSPTPGPTRANGVSFVAPGDPMTTGEVRVVACTEERLAALPLSTKISGPGATPPAITIDTDSIDVNAPITTGLVSTPALSGAGDPTGGYAFDSSGAPVFLMGGSNAMIMSSNRMTLFNRGLRTTGAGTAVELGAIGQGMFDGSTPGGLDFYVLNDSFVSTFGAGIGYNPTYARPVLYATALSTDGNLGMQGNLDNSITDPDGKLALAFGPYDGGCNGLDVPNDAASSAALIISMVIDSERIWRTKATGFQIEAGKTFSLDGGATTITGPLRGKTTWTPVVGDGTTNFTIASSGSWYQVIGGAVTFQTLFTISNKNGLGAQVIRMSLPTGTTSGTCYGQFGAFSALVMPSATTQLVARFSSGLNYASPIAREFSGGVMTETVCTANNFQTGVSYTYSGTYFI